MSHINPDPPFPLTADFLAEMRHNAEHYRESHDDLLPPTKAWHYLEARYEVDPARFTRWHPLIGKWIKQDLGHVAFCPAPTLPSIPVDPVYCGSTVTVEPNVVLPAPEPCSLTLWATAIVVIVAWKCLRRS